MPLSAVRCSVQKSTPITKTTSKENRYKAKLKDSCTYCKTTTIGYNRRRRFKVTLPVIKREFRGVWIASVAQYQLGLHRNNLSVDQQKAEAINMLNILQENNFNAVIFQARPSADALYTSELEPWSYFLTGKNRRTALSELRSFAVLD